jgi:hypothetical protein
MSSPCGNAVPDYGSLMVRGTFMLKNVRIQAKHILHSAVPVLGIARACRVLLRARLCQAAR